MVKKVDLIPESERPSLALGDAVYYCSPDTGQAHHGTVAAIGKHGMTIDADGGGEHLVTWDMYLGHRKRADRKLTIIDRGEDGSIMEDEGGRKVFVRGALDEYIPPEPPAADIDRERLIKAQVLRELAQAGLEPDPDYIRGAFGDGFVRKALEPAMAAPSPAPSPDVVAAIERLAAAQAAQFQGLCAAIGILAEKIGGTLEMQSTLTAVLAEARKPQPVNITLPESMAKVEPASVQVDVHVPQQPAPTIHVATPEIPAPVVHVAAPSITLEAPRVDVHVPDQPAPVVNVALPARKTITNIERDTDGYITRATQTETDLE